MGKKTIGSPWGLWPPYSGLEKAGSRVEGRGSFCAWGVRSTVAMTQVSIGSFSVFFFIFIFSVLSTRPWTARRWWVGGGRMSHLGFTRWLRRELNQNTFVCGTVRTNKQKTKQTKKRYNLHSVATQHNENSGVSYTHHRNQIRTTTKQE